jgi:uncharacterized membrane protein YcfT
MPTTNIDDKEKDYTLYIVLPIVAVVVITIVGYIIYLIRKKNNNINI